MSIVYTPAVLLQHLQTSGQRAYSTYYSSCFYFYTYYTLCSTVNITISATRSLSYIALMTFLRTINRTVPLQTITCSSLNVCNLNSGFWRTNSSSVPMPIRALDATVSATTLAGSNFATTETWSMKQYENNSYFICLDTQWEKVLLITHSLSERDHLPGLGIPKVDLSQLVPIYKYCKADNLSPEHEYPLQGCWARSQDQQTAFCIILHMLREHSNPE